MELSPDLGESVVVGMAAERAGAVTGRERRRLVEEEELGELAGLQERRAVPAAELELARDPALAVEAPPDVPGVVVEAAAVAVDEPASLDCNELAEWRDAVLPQYDTSVERLGWLDNRARAGAP